jgi:hypothetical protein
VLNKVAFPDRVRGKALKPGKTLSFTIVKR